MLALYGSHLKIIGSDMGSLLECFQNRLYIFVKVTFSTVARVVRLVRPHRAPRGGGRQNCTL